MLRMIFLSLSMPKKAKSAYAPQPLIKRTNGCVKFTISARKHSEIHPCKTHTKSAKFLKTISIQPRLT